MEQTSEFVVVSNRLPVSRDEEENCWLTSPGGLVSALVPILREGGQRKLCIPVMPR